MKTFWRNVFVGFIGAVMLIARTSFAQSNNELAEQFRLSSVPQTLLSYLATNFVSSISSVPKVSRLKEGSSGKDVTTSLNTLDRGILRGTVFMTTKDTEYDLGTSNHTIEAWWGFGGMLPIYKEDKNVWTYHSDTVVKTTTTWVTKLKAVAGDYQTFLAGAPFKFEIEILSAEPQPEPFSGKFKRIIGSITVSMSASSDHICRDSGPGCDVREVKFIENCKTYEISASNFQDEGKLTASNSCGFNFLGDFSVLAPRFYSTHYQTYLGNTYDLSNRAHKPPQFTTTEKFVKQVEADIATMEAAKQAFKEHVAYIKTKVAGLTTEDRSRAQSTFKQAFELFQSGEFDAAVISFKKGLGIDPANAVAHFYLAETYARQKNPALARRHYEFAREFGGNSKEAVLAESRLAALPN